MATSTSWAALVPPLLAAWSGDGSIALPDDETRTLAEQSPEHRRAFLELTRRELQAFPLERVHPRWIARELPADPCLQHWAMQLAPVPIRSTLARYFPSSTRPDQGRSWMEPTGPPAWFEGWWHARLRAAIDWPDELPWRRDDPHVLARLSRLAEVPLAATLERIGTRATAAAVHAEAPHRLLETLFGFPAPIRERLVVLVRERAIPPEPWWPVRWSELAGLEATTRLARLALIEIAAIAHACGRIEDARRLAWHLAPELGEPLHLELGSPAELAEPVETRIARLEGDLL